MKLQWDHMYLLQCGLSCVGSTLELKFQGRLTANVLTPALKPGRVIRVTFSPGLTRFTIYPGLTRIGSREKRNCSFDDVETYKRYIA